MEIDPRLAGVSAGSKIPSFAPRVAGVGASVAPSLSTPLPTGQLAPLQTHPGRSIDARQPLGFSAPLVFATSYPASATSQGAPSLASTLDQKRLRACESCRGLKVRCEPNEHNPFATCKRCAKANRECIFTAPSRKRQKKSDSKVAELEKKIDALTASLRAQQARAARGADDDDDEEEYLDDEDTPEPSDVSRPDAPELSPGSRSMKRRRSEDNRVEAPPMYPAPKGSRVSTTSHTRPLEDMPNYSIGDVVDRNILGMGAATRIFNHYVEDMTPHFPAVVFPDNTTAGDIRRDKPTLFLAILAAASGTSDPGLHRTLYKEISRELADKVMINGDKTLELIQALILCTMWYFVPDHLEELKFYMYIHQAAVMALEIGITKKKKKTQGSLRGLPPVPVQVKRYRFLVPTTGSQFPLPPPVHPQLNAPLPDSDSIESRRTLLACYWTCCNFSMAQKRPNFLRYTAFMDECIKELETSPAAAPTDKTLCEWVKLQKIAEEIGIGFAFDDPNATVSIDDERVQFSLKGFARQLDQWKSACPKEIFRESLELAYHLIVIYAHEISLHQDHSVDDFQPPYTESMMREPLPRPNLLSFCHIDAISRCQSSSHKLLDIFTSMSIKMIHSVPVFTLARVSHALVILMKLYFSASHPKSEIGKVVDKNILRVNEYMDKVVEILQRASEGRQAQRFTTILSMIRYWYQNQKTEIERGLNSATGSLERLELTEVNKSEGPRASGGTGSNVGLEAPDSIDDVSSAHAPEMGYFYETMGPPPLPLSQFSGATPRRMLSNTTLESSRGTMQQYTFAPSPAPSMEMTTPRSAPQTSYMFPMTQGDGSGMVDTAMYSGYVSGDGGYDVGGQDEAHEDGVGGVGVIGYSEGMGYAPQNVFTGNGMFMDDAFWTMMDGSMNMFDGGGKY